MKRKAQPKPEPPPAFCSWCNLGPVDEHVRARGIHEECEELREMRDEQAAATTKRKSERK